MWAVLNVYLYRIYLIPQKMLGIEVVICPFGQVLSGHMFCLGNLL